MWRGRSSARCWCSGAGALARRAATHGGACRAPWHKRRHDCRRGGHECPRHKTGGESLRVHKAVITAAAPAQRALPLQTLIDRDGHEKSVLCTLIEQSLAAGAEETAVVVAPGDESQYAQAAGRHSAAVRFL